MTVLAYDTKSATGFDTKMSTRGPTFYAAGGYTATDGFQKDSKMGKCGVVVIGFRAAEPDYGNFATWDADRTAWNDLIAGGEDDWNVMAGGLYHTGASSVVGSGALPDNLIVYDGVAASSVTVDDINDMVDLVAALIPDAEVDAVFFSIHNDDTAVSNEVDQVISEWNVDSGGFAIGPQGPTNRMVDSTLHTQAWLANLRTQLNTSKIRE